MNNSQSVWLSYSLNNKFILCSSTRKWAMRWLDFEPPSDGRKVSHPYFPAFPICDNRCDSSFSKRRTRSICRAIWHISLPNPWKAPLPWEEAVVETETLFCSKESGGAFKGGTHLIGELVGWNDLFNIYCDAFTVAVSKAEADGRDLSVDIRIGNHLYGYVGKKIWFHNGKPFLQSL